MVSMHNYDWPGNVRELQNTIHRYVTLKKIDFGGNPLLDADHHSLPPADSIEQISDHLDLRKAKQRFEETYIRNLLQKFHWHRGQAAMALNINRRTLFKKIRQYGIDKTPK